jgi:hypothetical protein
VPLKDPQEAAKERGKTKAEPNPLLTRAGRPVDATGPPCRSFSGLVGTP